MNSLPPIPFDARRHTLRRATLGLLVIAFGVMALLDNLQLFGIPLVHTFWPLALVVFGLARLAWPHHAGNRVFGLVLVVIGALLTAHNLGYGNFSLHQWWPLFVIAAGASIFLRGCSPRRHGRWRGRFAAAEADHTDEVDVDATFSGAQLKNDSRDFKGGRISVTFGGVELDLREAAMTAPEAILLVNATFGGIEVRVPRDWQVVVQASATMGAVEDKTAPPPSPEHRLVLRGEAVFGGIEIKN